MLRCVAGRVHDVDHHIAERQPVAVICGMEWKGHVRRSMQHIFRPCRTRESPAGRAVIGVHMGVDDEQEAHAGLVGRAQVWFYLPNRIDNGAARAPAAAEQVGNRNRVCVKELAEDHPDVSRHDDHKVDRRSFNQYCD